MNVIKRKNKAGDKYFFYYDYGRGVGQRPSTGIFVYVKPKDGIQRSHNKEALMILETKKSQLTIEQQAVGSAYIPKHTFKANFIDYYNDFCELNKRKGNRHLMCILKQFKRFIDRDFISPIEITDNLCRRFRQYLLDKYTGETPANYYARFKRVVNAAEQDGYFQKNPTAAVHAKANPSRALKEILEVDDYLLLLQTPCRNEEIQAAFIFSCYTALRWVDVELLGWADIKDTVLVTRIIQAKTGQPVTLTLHAIAQAILKRQKEKQQATGSLGTKVFALPTHDGANKLVRQWVTAAGIDKHITWSCARLSFSVLLQDRNTDEATVALLLGHRSSEHVRKTYKRHRPKNQIETINRLPMPAQMPTFLHCDTSTTKGNL
jgi:integrase